MNQLSQTIGTDHYEIPHTSAWRKEVFSFFTLDLQHKQYIEFKLPKLIYNV
jgi:hypothetical protein